MLLFLPQTPPKIDKKTCKTVHAAAIKKAVPGLSDVGRQRSSPVRGQLRRLEVPQPIQGSHSCPAILALFSHGGFVHHIEEAQV